MITREALIEIIKELISDEMGILKDEIKGADSFFILGLDSVSCIFLMDKLEKKLQIELNPIHFWDYPTLEMYSEFIVSNYLSDYGN